MDRDAAGKWLEGSQGVRIAPGAADESARTAERLGALARRHAETLPFDADPLGFNRVFEACAANG